jgi:magnesium-transporting ATPase (P-type)
MLLCYSNHGFLQWLAKFKAATVSTVDRDANIAAAGAELEQNMQCVGITAIEDRLQDEVPEVIADLAKANIILWMLTVSVFFSEQSCHNLE